ncbi:MAG TPA: nitronate monooxygenase [Acidimicrobiales bacterium]|nr:nitronate monooxygenase [Acidimicrobiales bacterium]
MLNTRFTELVGCDTPIQLAPMGSLCTPELVVAVTAGGGMGMVAPHLAPAPVVRDILDAVTAKAAGPVGINFLMPFVDRAAVEVAASKARVVDFYHGPVDRSLVDLVHEGGALAGWQVGSVPQARAAADAGCEVVVVRGTEGGGRMHGHRSLWPLLAEILDAVDGDGVVVLAAGGIATGRLIAAALAAGADGVRLGTRLLATDEAGAHPVYKQALVDAAASESVLTDVFDVMWPDPEKTSRVLSRSVDAASRFEGDVVAEMDLGGEPRSLPPFHLAPPTADARGHVDAMPHYAGESCGAITAIEPATALVRRLAAEAERHLRGSASDG